MVEAYCNISLVRMEIGVADAAGRSDLAALDVYKRQEAAVRQDTLWKDTATIDTIKTVGYTSFLPDNIVLRAFKEALSGEISCKIRDCRI